ncbi:MAG: hypothetical protein N3A54_06095, partial [Patescibacteria group bacterium]|nr:hypothetical protein [Patescibacteria group bacterium]
SEMCIRDRYDPHEFWETKESFFDAAGFYNVKSFGKYDFVRTNPVSYERDVLYILPADSALKEGVEVFRIHRLNGDPVLIGFHL